jgi:equilibrative nucleoside transporter 1/2/3
MFLINTLEILAFYWNIASTRENQTQDFSQVNTMWPILYFFFATGVGVATLLAFSILILRRRPQKHLEALQYLETYESMGNNRKLLQHSLFFKKSYLLALALFFCFSITTLSPVFASKIQSVKQPMTAFSISQPTIFIGTAFLTWDIGELLGSFVPLLPFAALKKPEIIFAVSVSRLGFIILYNVCNLNGRGAVVGGDIFYLVVVQGLSGLTSS